LARSSYKWEKTYKKRTAVERENARLDEAYGFEKHLRCLVGTKNAYNAKRCFW